MLNDSSILETPRLRMRPFRHEDFDDLYRLYSDPLVMRYITNGRPKTVEETREGLDRMIGHFRDFGYAMFALFHRSDGRFLGRCGLQPLRDTPWVELGYTLLWDAWGQGFATEAAKECVRFGFEVHKLPQLVAIVMSENSASRHVIEKCGLTYEKTEPYKEADDVAWYKMTRETYLSRQVAS